MGPASDSFKRVDRAYVCFLLPAFHVALTAAFEYLPSDSIDFGSVGFFIFLPLAIASVPALIMGLWLSFRVGRQEPSLVILSGSTVAAIVVGATQLGGELILLLVLAAYLAIAGFLEFQWFFVNRRTGSLCECCPCE